MCRLYGLSSKFLHLLHINSLACLKDAGDAVTFEMFKSICQVPRYIHLMFFFLFKMFLEIIEVIVILWNLNKSLFNRTCSKMKAKAGHTLLALFSFFSRWAKWKKKKANRFLNLHKWSIYKNLPCPSPSPVTVGLSTQNTMISSWEKYI